MNWPKLLIVAAVWYLTVIAAARYWYRRQPPPPRPGNPTATDWYTATQRQPATPPHGIPITGCQFQWSAETPTGTESLDTHHCALSNIHSDNHLCKCGARHDSESLVEW